MKVIKVMERTLQKELPQTGASASAYPLVGSLLVLLSGVVAFFRRKK
ncbi:LPXTG cell wall anchor domain-containing protein [Bacillus pacificus]